MSYYGLKDIGADSELLIFAEAASLITQCPSAFIGMMEEDQQTIQCFVGMELHTIPRQNTICQYTILQNQPLIIEDTLLDYRTNTNEVILQGNIRFYAGVPLLDNLGIALGTLCVFDFVPRSLSQEQMNSLIKLAKSVSQLLISRKKNQYADYFIETLELINNLICVLNPDFEILEANLAFNKLFPETTKVNFTKKFSDLFINSIEWNTIKSKQNCSEDDLQIITESLVDNKVVEIVWNIKCNQKKTEFLCFGRNITLENIEKVKLESSEKSFESFLKTQLV